MGLVLVLVGCDPSVDRIGRPRPTSSVVATYVAIGDGFTAGAQSGALAKRHQIESFPSILSLHFGTQTSTQQRQTPLISNPGFPLTRPVIGAGYLDVVDLSPLVLTRVEWDDPDLAAANARADMHTEMEINRVMDLPFRNLGVPGAFAYDVRFAIDSLTTWTGTFASSPNYLFETVLKPSVDTDTTLTVLDDAMAFPPSLTTVWLGTSEILASATSGGGPLPYEAPAFGAHLAAILDSLDAMGSAIVICTVPDVTRLPFFTTLRPVVADAAGEAVPQPTGGTPIPLLGEGGPPTNLAPGVPTLPPGSLVLLSARAAIARGAGIPDTILIARIMAREGVDAATAAARLPDAFPDHGTPLDGSLTLTPMERAGVLAAVEAYNAEIRAAAANQEAAIADLRALFARFDAGLSLAGVPLDTDFITGGLISLDGIHPTSLGYALIAAEIVDVVNAAFDAGVPAVDVGRYLDRPELPEPDEGAASRRASR